MFFQTGKATDPIYERVRNRVFPDELSGRAFIEEIWEDTSQYLDTDLAIKAPLNGLVPAYWEMYLAHALKRYGIGLVPREKRVPRCQGPDLFAESPDVWVEAVAATPGDGADTLAWGDPLKATQMPADRFILRLRTAIDYKSKQLKRHIEREYVKPGQATVIAVSGALLPYRWDGNPIPLIVRAVLGVGNLVLEFERSTMKSTGHGVEFCDEVTKANASSVKTDLFANDECSHVSAVLYGPSCWVDHPSIPGAEFIVVHNPFAATPLPDGWLQLGDEYWLDGDAMRHTRHAVNNWQ